MSSQRSGTSLRVHYLSKRDGVVRSVEVVRGRFDLYGSFHFLESAGGAWAQLVETMPFARLIGEGVGTLPPRLEVMEFGQKLEVCIGDELIAEGVAFTIRGHGSQCIALIRDEKEEAIAYCDERGWWSTSSPEGHPFVELSAVVDPNRGSPRPRARLSALADV